MIVQLTRGLTATVSDQDAALVLRHKWCAVTIGNTNYATTTIGGKNVYMHRLILGADATAYVDHANGNGLDNRRENIRPCSQSQNLANSIRKTEPKSSGRRGVYRHGRKWRVVVGRDHRGLNNYIGVYTTIEEAVAARNEAARSVWGKFAREA